MRRGSALVVLLAVGTTCPSIEAARADRVVARLGGDSTHVRGHGAWLVWSDQRPGEGRFRLMARRGGRTFALRGVRRRRLNPFDVDVGPGPDGRPVAVYTRDGRAWMRRLGRDARETRLPITVPKGGRVAWPTIWRERVAFAVRYANRPDEIRAGPIGGTQHPIRVGPTEDPAGERRGPPRALQLDMRGSRVVFAWRREARGAVEIHLATGRRHIRLLDRGYGDDGGAGYDRTGAPILQDGIARWAQDEERTGAPPNCRCLVSYDLRSRVLRRQPVASVRALASGVAADAGHLYVWDDEENVIHQLSETDWPVDRLPMPVR